MAILKQLGYFDPVNHACRQAGIAASFDELRTRNDEHGRNDGKWKKCWRKWRVWLILFYSMAENKERLIGQGVEIKQETKMVDVEKVDKTPLPEAVETWMRKFEKDPAQKTINDDITGQPLMTPSAPTDPRIQLPITRGTFTSGFSKAVTEAGKWLSVFIFRVIKIKKGKVKFKDE